MTWMLIRLLRKVHIMIENFHLLCCGGITIFSIRTNCAIRRKLTSIEFGHFHQIVSTYWIMLLYRYSLWQYSLCPHVLCAYLICTHNHYEISQIPTLAS